MHTRRFDRKALPNPQPNTPTAMNPSTVSRRFAPALYILFFLTGFLAARLWFNPQNHLAELPTTLAAVAALAVAYLSYLVAMYGIRLRAEEHRRTQTAQRESIHPILHAAVTVPADRPYLLTLDIHNSGKGRAADIRFRAAPVADKPAARALIDNLQALPVFDTGLDTLGTGEHSLIVFADTADIFQLLSEHGLNGAVRLTAEYRNIFGEPCKSESILDLGAVKILAEQGAFAAR
ncbi:hypothetical protein [Neisseria sp.]